MLLAFLLKIDLFRMSLLESIVEASPDAVVVCDTRGIINVWNRAAVELFGWSVEEAIGRTPADLFVPPELSQHYADSLQQIAQNSIPGRTQHKITVWNKNQKRIAVELCFDSVEIDGQTQIVGYFRDHTQVDYLETLLARQNLESRILDSASLYSNEEESFENALQQAMDTLCELTGWPLGHAMLPSENDQHLISSAVWSTTDAAYVDFCEARSGGQFSRGQNTVRGVWITGKPAWQMLVDPEAEIGVANLPDGIRSQFCVPIKMRTKVIAVLEFFLQDSEAPDAGLQSLVKKLSRSLGTIIERREWEEERRRMAAIVESSYDAILSKDPAGMITSWNEGAERLYGYTADEAIGQSARLILPETMAREESEILESLKKGQRLEQFETKRRRRNGQVFSVSLTISPLRNSEGKVIGSASIERDITRRKEAQYRLQEAIVAATEANLAKTEFMANISHELRTPMNAILGMTQLSLQEEIPDAVRDYLTTAKDSADTMLFLINDILDFSRLEADRFELDPAPFDIRHTLEETLRTLSLRAHEKGLELAASVHPDVPSRVVGDAMRLRQVLTNLIGNAIKFTQSGEVVVTIDLADQDFAEDESEWNVGDLARLQFCVRDTGIGISEADKQRIFAPFTQADASTTRTYAGTGLGLSICQELVKLMDGRVWVESDQDDGSRFYFTVELYVAAATDDELTHHTISLDKLKNTPVLIVDDNGTTRNILQKMLKSWSMEPVTADSADAALDEIKSASRAGEGFPLLIVDAMMPNHDGIELLETIEQSAESVGATILMMSPADQQLFRSRAKDIEVSAVLEKPVSQSGLLNAISAAFGALAFGKKFTDHFQTTSSPLKVLVAEDIAANQKVMTAFLTKRGHEATIAHNGREAIDLYQRQPFDAILMDVQMPIMDGLQAVRAIRSSESSGQHIPIIAMTAHAMRGDREACLVAGMDAYVSKPIDAALLLNTLERLARPASPSESIESIAKKSGTWRFRESPETSGERADADESTQAKVDTPVWQPHVALRRLGDDRSLLVSMIDYFFEDSPDLLKQLPAAIEAENVREATRLAHSLKGLCSNFEATQAVAVAASIEMACCENRLANATAQLSLLGEELQRLSSELAVWKAES